MVQMKVNTHMGQQVP